MATEIEFTPMSKEKWQKTLLSTDATEKTLGMKLLKAAAKHNGMRNVLAYMSKTAEGKAEVIYEYQQEVNPYKANGASDVEVDAEEAETASSEEEAAEEPKKRRASKRKTMKRREDAAAKSEAKSEEEPASEKAAAAPAVDLGPIKASLVAIKEAIDQGSEEREALDEKLNTVIARLAGLDKWLTETHAMMRFFVSSQEGMYEMMTDPELVEEFYGKSAFEDDSSGN